MKKLFFACIFVFSLIGCDFQGHHHPHPSPDSYSSYQYYTYDMCWGDEEPFWGYPDYCDYHCCTWYVGDGCWEEWCYFDKLCGWEYYQGWCY